MDTEGGYTGRKPGSRNKSKPWKTRTAAAAA